MAQAKTLHFWLAFIASAIGIVNASGVVPMTGHIHDGVFIASGLIGLLAYQLGYRDIAASTPTPPVPPNTTGGGK